jgi:flagellar basal body rod protein FlgC
MSLSISLSGLNAASRRFDSAAFDVARASTQRLGQPVTGVEPIASVQGASGQAPTPARPVPVPPPAQQAGAQPGPTGLAQPTAEDPDLPRTMVDMITASNAVLANVQAIRRQNESLDVVLKLR